MDEPIISREHIRAKARRAFDRGVRRDGHGFNWHATGATEVWQEEWDKQYAAWTQRHSRASGNVQPLAERALVRGGEQ